MKKRWITLVLAAALAFSLLPWASAAPAYTPVKTGKFQNHVYWLFDDKITPPEAEAYCKSIGGHLATITSAEEQAFVASLCDQGKRGHYTIGATDRDQNGVWMWMNGEMWGYTNWGPGEPRNATGAKAEDYVGLAREWGWQWNDYFGAYNNYRADGAFVCEFDRNASNWAQSELEKADEYDLIPDSLQGADYTKPITRLEFAALSVKVFENLAGTKTRPAEVNPFLDCDDLELRKAYALGITNGTSDTTFTPNGLLTREQAAAMLTRTFKRSVMPGWTLAQDSQPQYKLNYTMPKPFADDGKISAYARDSVYFMAANGIIGGVGNNLFAPNNQTPAEQARGYANATREQALAIAVRIVENLK